MDRTPLSAVSSYVVLRTVCPGPPSHTWQTTVGPADRRVWMNSRFWVGEVLLLSAAVFYKVAFNSFTGNSMSSYLDFLLGQTHLSSFWFHPWRLWPVVLKQPREKWEKPFAFLYIQAKESSIMCKLINTKNNNYFLLNKNGKIWNLQCVISKQSAEKH